MRSSYFIDKVAMGILRETYRDERASYPDCKITFGWGGDATGRRGVVCGMYDDSSQPMPPIFYYQEVPVCFLFPHNIPEEIKSGVLCFRDNEFKILPAENFDLVDLIEGFSRKEN